MKVTATYRIHSKFQPSEYEQHSLGVDIYFRKAVLGDWGDLPLDTCHNHYFSPADWDAFSGFGCSSLFGPWHAMLFRHVILHQYGVSTGTKASLVS